MNLRHIILIIIVLAACDRPQPASKGKSWFDEPSRWEEIGTTPIDKWNACHNEQEKMLKQCAPICEARDLTGAAFDACLHSCGRKRFDKDIPSCGTKPAD